MSRSLFARLRFASLAGLVLFAPDDGGAAGGDAGNAGAGDGGDGAAAGGDQGGNADPLAGLTPEQQAAVEAVKRDAVNKAIAPKVSAERSKWENDLKAMAAAEQQTAEQQAQTARQAAEAERDAARREALSARAEAAFERALIAAKVPAERIPAGVRLADFDLDAIAPDGKLDQDAIKALAASTVQANAFLVAGTTPPGASGGEHQGGGDRKIWTPKEIAELAKNPVEFAKHEAEIDRQVREGLITA